MITFLRKIWSKAIAPESLVLKEVLLLILAITTMVALL